ncbi:ERI1 exoribonuclease 2 isoform X3 [Prionailurus bengalensis]|uniref:ERI1 exoribonuclease 2 isoform X3 n=1 Tax=Prionailurus bengalensis TaxID=37029 RepID=UPI001CA90058|nr:ERI1 exoribonuclease 2 isoform X3 [Prionailurus bengalensis]
MATKRLARQLGLIRRKSVAPTNGNVGRSKSKQLFDYLIVIDFESTCWNDGKRHQSQEIIEFPAVLLSTSTEEIESEFHTYVQPQEHPILSEFCMELTGIKQAQVDEGVPLRICLSQFCKWIQKIQQQKKIIFATGISDLSNSEVKLCAFVTWSDWDLGVCLEYECKRKQLLKPVFLNSWIDLRVTYKIFYRRKPKGLSGALQEVGIEFLGREHSGLDDSRNTALLAWKMIRDGCLMKITRSLNKESLHPMWGSNVQP